MSTRSHRIAREEARLRAVFHRLLALSLVAAPAACSSNTPSGPEDGGGQSNVEDAKSGVDSTVGEDAAGPEIDGGAGIDATVDDVYSGNPGCLIDSGEVLDGAGDGSGCDIFVKYSCGLFEHATTSGCYLYLSECAAACGQTVKVCAVNECLAQGDGGTIPQTGPITIDCATGLAGCGAGVGRRPEGLVDAAPACAEDAAGAWLADVARLEAASVWSFRRLAGELVTMGAPASLVKAARRSARDEVRHARDTSRLARRRGAAPSRVAVSKRARARSLAAFAMENVVEGCVREGFGAFVALHQAKHAKDAELARAMERIAADETRHAALARSIARWLEPQLDEVSRARVAQAARDAVASLRCEIAHTDATLAAELGLPSGAAGAAMVDAFAAALVA